MELLTYDQVKQFPKGSYFVRSYAGNSRVFIYQVCDYVTACAVKQLLCSRSCGTRYTNIMSYDTLVTAVRHGSREFYLRGHHGEITNEEITFIGG